MAFLLQRTATRNFGTRWRSCFPTISSMVRGGITLFNGFNQRLAKPPVIKPNIYFVTLSRRRGLPARVDEATDIWPFSGSLCAIRASHEEFAQKGCVRIADNDPVPFQPRMLRSSGTSTSSTPALKSTEAKLQSLPPSMSLRVARISGAMFGVAARAMTRFRMMPARLDALVSKSRQAETFA